MYILLLDVVKNLKKSFFIMSKLQSGPNFTLRQDLAVDLERTSDELVLNERELMPKYTDAALQTYST